MSTYTVKTGVENHPLETFAQLETDLLSAGGVVDPTKDFLLSVTGTNMIVSVGAGKGYALDKEVADKTVYRVRSDETTNLDPIPANNSGFDRIDTIVLYVDLLADVSGKEQEQGIGFAKFKAIPGTPAQNPVAPTEAEISQDSEVGSNPFIVIGDIYVGNGVSAITADKLTQRTVAIAFKDLVTNEKLMESEYVTPNPIVPDDTIFNNGQKFSFKAFFDAIVSKINRVTPVKLGGTGRDNWRDQKIPFYQDGEFGELGIRTSTTSSLLEDYLPTVAGLRNITYAICSINPIDTASWSEGTLSTASKTVLSLILRSASYTPVHALVTGFFRVYNNTSTSVTISTYAVSNAGRSANRAFAVRANTEMLVPINFIVDVTSAPKTVTVSLTASATGVTAYQGSVIGVTLP